MQRTLRAAGNSQNTATFIMTTKKTLNEQVNEVLNSRMSVNKKTKTLIKLGVTPYEAMFMARASMVVTPRRPLAPRHTFTYTFGVEMETINCRPSDFIRAAADLGLSVIDHTACYSGCHTDIAEFKLVPDGSLSGSNTAECVTPALNSNEVGFESLKKCCTALKTIGATTNKSCGLHVHIGARNLTDQEFCNVFVNYMMLETAIESFLAPSRRGSNAHWCYSLRRHEYAVLDATTKSEMRQALNYDRYHRVNAEAYNRHQTIEFRQHQGTINYRKVEAWVKFLGKLVEFSKTNRLTERIDTIENIPFLEEREKNYFISRREALA